MKPNVDNPWIDKMSDARPFISIIVPTYNRQKQLAACLQSLDHLEYPCDCYEVLVVDDGSSTPPETIVNAFKQRMNIRLIIQPHAGPATARNTGAAQAKGEYIAFTDDDCVPHDRWLQAMAAALLETPDVIVGGHTINQFTDNVFSTASQLLIDYLQSYYNDRKDQARFFTSNNMAVLAHRFWEIGGFDTSFPIAAAEDRELCDRWLFHGFRLVYVPEAIVYHAHALALRTFWRQHFNYGCGAFHFHEIRRRRNNGRIHVEPLSFYLSLLQYPFLHTERRRGIPLATSMCISQIANAMGFYRMKFSQPNTKETRQ